MFSHYLMSSCDGKCKWQCNTDNNNNNRYYDEHTLWWWCNVSVENYISCKTTLPLNNEFTTMIKHIYKQVTKYRSMISIIHEVIYMTCKEHIQLHKVMATHRSIVLIDSRETLPSSQHSRAMVSIDSRETLPSLQHSRIEWW